MSIMLQQLTISSDSRLVSRVHFVDTVDSFDGCYHLLASLQFLMTPMDIRQITNGELSQELQHFKDYVNVGHSFEFNFLIIAPLLIPILFPF